MNSFFFRATGAAENPTGELHAVADDAAAAVFAMRSERVNRALKAIEDVADMVLMDFKCLIVIVTANFTLWHDR